MAVKIEPHIDHQPVVQDLANGPKASVLLVDDNSARSTAARDELARIVIDCDLVHSVEDAVRAFTACDYHLIILNFTNAADAIKAAREIRAVEKIFFGPRIPVVCFAGGAQVAEATIDQVCPGSFNPSDIEKLLESNVHPTRFLNPREPVNFRKLLRSCGRDDAQASQIVAAFEKQLAVGIEEVSAALQAGDVDLLHRVALQLRDHARQACSACVVNTAVFLSCLNGAGPIRSFVPGAIEELRAAAGNLSVWRALRLGQSAAGMKRRSAASKTVVSLMSNFSRQRNDVFAKPQ